MIRLSGTELKLKIYVSVSAADEALAARVERGIVESAEEMFIP